MTSNPNPKILAIGAPLGDLKTLALKIKTFQKKGGPFECCVILGDLFKADSTGEELTPDLEFVIPTYFLLGSNPLPADIEAKTSVSPEIVKNLIYLGKAGTFQTSGGVKIAYLGGKLVGSEYKSESSVDQSILTPTEITNLLSTSLLQSSSILSTSASAAPTPPPSVLALANGLPKKPSNGPPPAAGSLAAARLAAEQEKASKEADVAKKSASEKGFAKGIDLLLLSNPPPFIEQHSATYPPVKSNESTGPAGLGLPNKPAPINEPFALFLQHTRPRYMLWSTSAGMDKSEEKWEREPFGWRSGGTGEDRFTRAVRVERLGDVEGDEAGSKRKFYYAFTLPSLLTAPPKPTDSTSNPYARSTAPLPSQAQAQRGIKRPAEDQGGEMQENFIWGAGAGQKRGRMGASGGRPVGEKPPDGYACVKCGSTEHYVRECPEKGQPRAPPAPKVLASEDCWFCLSNPKLTKELIVSIRESCYVALAKGQIIPTGRSVETGFSSKPPVPGGGHCLIIPFGHYTTHLNLPSEESLPIQMEMDEIKEGLAKTFADHDCVPVYFENIRPTFGHGHVQVVPVPKSKADGLEKAFRDAGAESGIQWETDPSAFSKNGKVPDCFKVDLPNGTQLVHLTRPGFNFQFGRIVLATLLGVPHRADWHQCMETPQEAQRDKVAFTAAILKHLPDIDDD